MMKIGVDPEKFIRGKGGGGSSSFFVDKERGTQLLLEGSVPVNLRKRSIQLNS